MCVVSEDAFAAGAASLPGPITDVGSDLWFVHQYLYAPIRVASDVGQIWGAQYAIDSRAMRKISDEERAVLVVESTASGGASFACGIRLLATLSRA